MMHMDYINSSSSDPPLMSSNVPSQQQCFTLLRLFLLMRNIFQSRLNTLAFQTVAKDLEPWNFNMDSLLSVRVIECELLLLRGLASFLRLLLMFLQTPFVVQLCLSSKAPTYYYSKYRRQTLAIMHLMRKQNGANEVIIHYVEPWRSMVQQMDVLRH